LREKLTETSLSIDDEILKQSQSAHFFDNKNNGKEYFEDDVVKSTKAPAKQPQKVRGRQRGRSKFRNVNNANSVTTAPPRTSATVTSAQTRQTFTNTPIVVQPSSNSYYDGSRTNGSTTLQSSNNYRTFASTVAPQTSTAPQSTTRDETFFDVPKVNPKAQTTKLKSAPVQNYQPQPSSTAAPQIPAGFPFLGAIPQRVIIPSQLSPEQRAALVASNGNNFQSTASSVPLPSTTASPQFVPQFNRVSPNPNQLRQNNDQKQSQKEISVLPQKFNFKTQKYESVDLKPTTQFYNPNYETKGTEEPFSSNRQAANKTYAQRQSTTVSSLPTTFNPQQYYQSEQSQYQNLSPRGFSLAATAQKQKEQIQVQPLKQSQQEIRPQITSRSEQARTHKKFSTLVPKDQYNPTTFKPSNGFTKKPIDQFAPQKLEKVQNPDKYYSQYTPTQTTQSTTTVYTTPYPQINNFHTQQFQHNNFQHQTTTRQSNFFSSTSTARPLADGEEDDGQYRPELYEKDFYRNKAKTTKITPAPVRNNFNNFYQTSSTTFKPQNNFNNNNSGDEDELFKTAHSQNIFASGNALRAEKEREKSVVKFDYSTTITEKSSPRPFSKPTQPPTQLPPKSTVKTTAKPRREKIEKDVSYDYQYYDTNADTNDYSELEAIEEFGKTAKKIKKN
jgi:hypothetical protein